MVKEFLSLRGAEFTNKNVSIDSEARAELLAMGHNSTPVVLIGDRTLTGFNVMEIDEALAALGEN